jgi:Protein of unknown function (DUF1598)
MSVSRTLNRAIISASVVLMLIAFVGIATLRKSLAQTTTTTTTGTTTTGTTTTTTTTTTSTTSTTSPTTLIINGTNPFGGVSVVGGVSVNVDGVLKLQDSTDKEKLLAARRQAFQAVPGNIQEPAKLRSVSLRKLEQAIYHCARNGQPLPDAIRYLAGLQRVQYVFVYPDQHDIVLAGPAEGWKLNAEGEVVGNVSGRPVLQLDDLVVALRGADQARNGGMTCSIDPTPEGLQRVSALLSKQTAVNDNVEKISAALEQASGPQKITLHGLPEDSRFAQVLVTADYRMKRLGMNFEASPVKGMPSYMELVSPNVHAVQTPRWWLAPKYDPLATDGEGLAWEIRGPGVQCMAEEDFFSGGQRQQSAKASPAAQKWADSMTEHYEELAEKDAIFGDLRNCMDLAVVGALIQKENLLDKVDLHLPYLLNDKMLATTVYNPPKQVDSKVSFVKKGKNFVLSVSGGVALQPWEIIQKQETSKAIDPIRTASAEARASAEQSRADPWWWNG